MSERKLKDSLNNLERAMSKLEAAISVPVDRELVMEGTIHRFEYTIELMWKTLKRALKYEGVETKTPRESLKESFQIGWLHDEAVWLDMLDHRNTTSHNYLAEELVEDNYQDIKKIAPIMRSVLDMLVVRYKHIP